MRIKLLILTYLFLFFRVSSVFAIDPPSLISPQNNSTATSSKLEWQTPSYPIYTQGNPYIVQVKNIPTFTSQDDRYKTNTYYTPKLSDGIWYWRVKAKNSDGIWSNWSDTWSFNLTTSTSTTTPTPSPSPTPASPVNEPTPTSNSSSADSSSSPSSFTISNIPSQINSDQSFSVSVNLTLPNNTNSTFYLKGAFKKPEGSNYFGLTKVNSSWIKNGSSYSNQYLITTNSTGNWSGNLEVKPDSEDSGFIGSGDYIFKLARYTSSGSGPTWNNNEANINIVQTNISTNQDTTDQQTVTDNSSPSNVSSFDPSPNVQKTTLAKSTSSPKLNYQIASVAGTSASAGPKNEIKKGNKKPKNIFLIIGLSLVFVGIGSLGYIYWKRR